MQKIIKPGPISGFPEWLPSEKILEEKMLGIIRETFERFGFVPMETPAVEKNEVLLSKGGNEKEIYTLARLAATTGEDAKEYSLHFDLTVPLARYVAQHYGNLIFPFRRYQIQKVWRGERPQDGRFREFYQCDIDIIGEEKLDLLADAEIPSVIYQVFNKLKIGPFLIRINNRKLLTGLMVFHNVPGENHSNVLRTIDKVEKVGRERVKNELSGDLGLSQSCVDGLLDLISRKENSKELIQHLGSLGYGEIFETGVSELKSVTENLSCLGVPAGAYQVDLSVARGLDYYTGTVYETILKDHPDIGSICSGGRFDNLAGNFTKKKLPGVGISIGLTRLFSRLLAAGIIKPGSATIADIMISVMNRSFLGKYLSLGARLRETGYNLEIYTEPKNLKKQMQYASRKGFKYVLIAGEEEFGQGKVKIKNMKTGEESSINLNDLEKKASEIFV